MYIEELLTILSESSQTKRNLITSMFYHLSVTMQRYNWDIVLDLLESEIWIDKQTRAVFVEFVINNMNVNIFTQVKILIETPILGGNNIISCPNYSPLPTPISKHCYTLCSGVFVSSQVNSFRPYPYRDVWDFVFLVLQCIWFLILCYIVFKEIGGIYCKSPSEYIYLCLSKN